ncbi:25-hydroxyvitamin D-1 alpha hydroxylase, mitochondrial [Cyprinodon tularosa]|uniref:25-hydroxyvitamin D-1 alpha hydroxylase, mitochondrial n=1 Tax=Cyprinodon tularosa TaxID=77115 RepID=UPI0018E25C55|nr:25-hydroxyvitamin D-1 alpha hydroxylase, mitochondrial [Cyprinodon tularosa]XP_038159439.1 25-hydroxyvitamin D-1 alpha hydroxylase, mitochondrial [Cyprinodon tularosa]
MIFVRRMLQQALRVSVRNAFPLVKWMERWAEGAAAPQLGSPLQAVKTLDDMPGPTAASFAWDLFARGGLSRLHELQMEGVQRYGPMWKASFGPILTVHVADPALIEQVLRQEGQHPMRSDLSSWKDYRKLRGHHFGLLTAEGEEWQAVRSLLGKHMLRPKAVEVYDTTLNGVVNDLIAKLRLRRSPQGLITDITSEFYRFGLEGISSVLFESRIGCLDTLIPEETERFIQSINTMFVMTLLTMAMPSWLHQLFPKPWKIFCQCWDYMFEFAKGHIDQRLTEEAEKIARGEKVEGRYLTYFLSQTGLPMKTVYSNVTELLLAGVDTISSTMSWTLYELSRHPEIQAALREEVLTVLDGRTVPDATDVARMPLLKATVKEVLRLYPVIPANARVIAEKDIQVGGYLIPKNTLITLCQFATSRDPAVFSNPDDFHPHRWFNKDEAHHPYASVPFGVGKRSCIGRRIAELELYLALSRILTEFEVKPDPEGVSVKPMTRTLLVPENAINLQFVER